MVGSLNLLFKEARKNYKIIEETYKILEKSYDLKIPIHSAGQWVLDNMYVIKEQYYGIRQDERTLKYKKLPIIKDKYGNKTISIYYLACELVENNTGYIDQNIILNTLKEHQKLSYLSSEELDLFLLMLRLALIKFISRICFNICNSQLKKIDVENIISHQNNIKHEEYIKKFRVTFNQSVNFREYMLDTNNSKSANTAFIEYMSYRLKEMGDKGEKYYDLLSQEAEKIGFTVTEAIIKEHKEIARTTEHIGRAISSYKRLTGINFREIFEHVNKIDETLDEDFTKEFRKCDYKTKNRYRRYIIKLAKKYNVSEVYIAKKCVECSVKYQKHVGFFLIGEEKYLLKKELEKPYLSDMLYYKLINPIKSHLYILSMILIACILTTISYKYIFHFDTLFKNIILNIFMFVFSLEVSNKLLDYILRKIVKPKTLPRFDFAKTVDQKYPTYVVMPTIISSIEKLDLMINKMEITYLANRSENMYYMLLGDCISSDKEHLVIDEKIVKYATEKLKRLNEKYPSEHVIFNFMYRKRVYSESEGSYMGWERKRGALQHFNELVLGKLSNEEIDKKMYLIYDDIIDAKYAITIDEDTELSLNTAKDLVAIIAHPLNQPVLSKDGTKVVNGYGLIQPSIGLDIEAANKSIFAKIFGGFGGLDIYTNAVANTYQDVFREAIFSGKGIYNIELFESLVAKQIPENLVLSHDLLEGSIIRAGLASDIELQDGFPNNYIAYMKRNHRWYRGDIQIIRWLFGAKPKLNLLSRWKIFDNLRRPLLNVFGVLAMLLTLIFDPVLFVPATLITFISINFGSILGILNRLVYGSFRHTKELQYIPIIHGLNADLLTICFNFVTMPYVAWTAVNAFITSTYRMLISKKKLLQWTTGEMLEKMSKNSLNYYMYSMGSNLIFAVILVAITILVPMNKFTVSFATYMAIAFIFAPIFAYLLGKDHLISRRKRLDNKKQDEILEIAERTWFFFDSMMTATNNYLPTDNYQENRRIKIVNRTSCTNIGFGILSIINAYDLKFITEDEAVERLYNIYNTIAKLEKWNGHLYNWYNIKTLEPLRPRFVSTVDSGNFVACLYVAKEFFEELIGNKDYVKLKTRYYDSRINELIKLNDKLIEDVDYTVLYNTDRNLFSIGYNQEIGKLEDSYYDMLMSESRTTSLIAIASRQITSKHWFALARNLVKVDGYKGLTSWTGTAFEFFMPYIFNKSYEHTLIDQSLFFSEYSQIKYAKANNVPWGVSECAFAVKDNELNYQYKAFGIPWLGLKRGLNDYLIVSPYSSLLMIEYDPESVYKNIKALKNLGMYSSYGFYEAIDYTKEHIDSNKSSEIVKTYMAHHQGMILASINNYINKGIIKNRFHSNPNIKACDILLKERERIKATIKKDTKDKDSVFKQKNIEKYTTFVSSTYTDREVLENENIKNNNELAIAFLRGSELSTIVTNTGASFLKYNDKIINRQRYTDTATSGNFVYITDKTTGKCISLTDTDLNSPYNKDTLKSNFVATLGQVEYYIEGEEIETNTAMTLSPEYNVEIKKVSLYNNSDKRREILINTYLEPAMTDFMTNVVHPSFSNLLIETYYDKDLDTLIASKRKKTPEDTDIYVFSKLVGIDLDVDVETEKMKLSKNDFHAYDGNIAKYPLWPVLSYRATIILDPYERQEFYYYIGATNNKYKISNAVVNLDKETLDKQFRLSAEMNNVTARYLKLVPDKAKVYNNMIKEVIFDHSVNNDKTLWNINLKQSALWKYSISGDLPIILVDVSGIENAGIVNEVINFMDYAKNRKCDIDIILIINEKQKDNGPIYTYLKTRLDRAVYMDYGRGNIYILNVQKLTEEELKLLSYLSRKNITNVNEFFTTEKEIEVIQRIDNNENINSDITEVE